jgi:chromosome segregation ATPase
MSENNTQETDQSKSFEERVFLRFDSVDARLDSVDARLDSVDTRLGSLEGRVEKLEQKQYDTKPIWEQALAAIAETNVKLADTNTKMEQGFAQVNAEFVTLRNEIEHSLHGIEWQIDALNQNVLQLQANQRYVNKRLHHLESQPKPT